MRHSLGYQNKVLEALVLALHLHNQTNMGDEFSQTTNIDNKLTLATR